MGGFWEGFGSSSASLGALLNLFVQGFFAKRAQEGPRGGQEVSWARFWMDLEGFWEGSGRVWGVKIYVFLAFSVRIAQDNIRQHKIA